MATPEQFRPSVRAGVFNDWQAADRAVQSLRDAGFTVEQINVVCSDETKTKYLHQYEHQVRAGQNMDTAVPTGSAVGATVGGLAAIAFGAVSGAVPLVIAGATGLMGGGAIGGYVGAMMTRGEEKELSNYYDQAVLDGRILVAVEDTRPDAAGRLARAAQILSESGAEVVRLPEG